MEDVTLRLLYGTPVGRAILKILIRPGLSRAAGRYLDSPLSRWLIAPFIRRNRIDMAEYECAAYPSFNAFFTRQKREEYRRFDADPARLISPCDGFLSAYPVEEDGRYAVKGVEYSLEELLADAELAPRFRGGYCFIFRLTPQNYHRYCYVDDGMSGGRTAIPGVLHCVRPVACERYPVYAQNSREYELIATENFGEIVQMEVGALLVGRIRNHPAVGPVRRGEEKGCFEFGGSTIVLLFERGRVAPDLRIVENMRLNRETPVRMGERIGEREVREISVDFGDTP